MRFLKTAQWWLVAVLIVMSVMWENIALGIITGAFIISDAIDSLGRRR